jgi:lysophospholipase L1-like esterase
MKLLKYIIILLLLVAAGGAFWLYYPQYQINKMQKATGNPIKDSNHKQTSYLEYFHSLNTSQIDHLAIGDSVIKGVGANQNEDFVSKFSAELKQVTNKSVVLTNKGIPGVTSTELNKLVQQGNYDEEMKKADIITINVGGNDILRLAKQKNYYQALHSFGAIQTDFTMNLTQITKHIKELNPNATLVYLELYNPLNPKDEFYSFANKLLPKWNVNIYKVASQFDSSLVVQTSKVINDQHLQYLAADGIHPNSQGYTAISRQMFYEFQHSAKRKSA